MLVPALLRESRCLNSALTGTIYRESLIQEMKTKQKMLRGWCSRRVIWNFFSKQSCSGYVTWTRWNFFNDFSQRFELRAVDRSVFCHIFAEACFSSSSIPISQSPPSTLSKPPPSSRLGVLFFVSFVMSIYLSIELSVHFFSPGPPAADGSFVCYTIATLLAAAS